METSDARSDFIKHHGSESQAVFWTSIVKQDIWQMEAVHSVCEQVPEVCPKSTQMVSEEAEEESISEMESSDTLLFASAITSEHLSSQTHSTIVI
jgi:hypothetical protein